MHHRRYTQRTGTSRPSSSCRVKTCILQPRSDTPQRGQRRGLMERPRYAEQPGQRQLRSENAAAPTTRARNNGTNHCGGDQSEVGSPKTLPPGVPAYKTTPTIHGNKTMPTAHCRRRRRENSRRISDSSVSVYGGSRWCTRIPIVQPNARTQLRTCECGRSHTACDRNPPLERIGPPRNDGCATVGGCTAQAAYREHDCTRCHRQHRRGHACLGRGARRVRSLMMMPASGVIALRDASRHSQSVQSLNR